MRNEHHPTAAAVRQALSEARRTQTEAAEQLGVSQAAISRRLSGEVEFTAAELHTLAAWLARPVGDLIGVVAA